MRTERFLGSRFLPCSMKIKISGIDQRGRIYCPFTPTLFAVVVSGNLQNCADPLGLSAVDFVLPLMLHAVGMIESNQVRPDRIEINLWLWSAFQKLVQLL